MEKEERYAVKSGILDWSFPRSRGRDSLIV